MKKRNFIRFLLISFLAMTSLYQYHTASYGARKQAASDNKPPHKLRPSGEFLILESITRYVMAAY